MAEITSAYEALGELSWDDLVDETDLLRDAVEERLKLSRVADLLFEEETTSELTVGYRTDMPSGDPDEVEKRAEFGNIPVFDPEKGREFLAKMDSRARGMRVSYEQTKTNGGKAVQREVRAMTNAIARSDTRAALLAVEKRIADSTLDDVDQIEVVEATAQWADPATNPLDPVWSAADLIEGAEYEGISYGYFATTIWGNPVDLSVLKRHPKVRDLYVGDMASSNPLFAGVESQPLIAGQFQLVPDATVPRGTTFVFQDAASLGGAIGSKFTWDSGQPLVTGWYSEKGESARGGSNMSYRSDYSEWNHMGIRAPKAIIKITGI